MGKALSLADDLMDAPPPPPLAAKAKMVAKPAPVVEAPVKVKKVPLQILVTPEDAKAIKRAALDADLSYSDFMVSCFHRSMKT
jgi:hypothetical protein